MNHSTERLGVADLIHALRPHLLKPDAHNRQRVSVPYRVLTPLTTLEVLQGEPSAFTIKSDSGSDNTRYFCRDCGSRLWAVLESGLASVNGMTLDDRTHFKLVANHRLVTAPSWCQIDADTCLRFQLRAALINQMFPYRGNDSMKYAVKGLQ